MEGPSETRGRSAGVQFATKRGARCELEIRGRPDLELRASTTLPSDRPTGSSRDRSARSTGAPRRPGRERSARGRTAGARTSPSGRARGTGRSGRSWRGATRTRRSRAPPDSTTRTRCRSLRAAGATRAFAPSEREPSRGVRATVFVNCRTRFFAYASEERACACWAFATNSDRRFSKNRIVPRYFRSAATLRSRRSSSVSARCSTFALPGACVVLSLHRCRRGLCHETEREQANE